MGGGFEVDDANGGVEVGCALELAFRMAAGLEMGAETCTDLTGSVLLTPEVVVSIAEASGVTAC